MVVPFKIYSPENPAVVLGILNQHGLAIEEDPARGAGIQRNTDGAGALFEVPGNRQEFEQAVFFVIGQNGAAFAVGQLRGHLEQGL